jgi:hypothetical protein
MFFMGAFLFSQIPSENKLKCTYSLGTNWLFPKEKKENHELKQLEQNSSLQIGDSLHSKEQSLCEILNDQFQVRIGSNSIFEFNNDSISITRGSLLLYKRNVEPITIHSELSSLKTTGEYTAIIECTSNGGFKFIPLEGKGEIFPAKGKPKEIFRGRLTMVLGSPSKLGNAYDIDLLLLLKSSRLINAFPTPLPSMKRISLSIYAQQLRIKGKYNALIGDVPTDDNIQMWAFGEDGSKE